MNLLKIALFDCSCSVGKRMAREENTIYEVDKLIEKMNQYQIEKCMVYHSLSREYDAKIGNEELLKIKNDRVIPVWTLLPNHTEEFYSKKELLYLLKKFNIRAVTLFPKEHNYIFSSWNLKEIFEMLEENKIPLLIEVTDWNLLYQVLKDFPRLVVILKKVGYRADRMLYPILNEFPFVYVETMGYKTFFGIESICQKFGAKRLVFGSGMPIHSGGGAATQLLLSDISNEEKEMIAFYNMDRILKECCI